MTALDGWGTDALASSSNHGSKGIGHNVKVWFSITYFKGTHAQSTLKCSSLELTMPTGYITEMIINQSFC
ncbi:MAG TPA: hypothetical protein VFG77_07525 [Nitrososphaeraceae archaeon]|nr:hypothetical protein [Nitrososphaeraceae archaeon]